MASIAVAQDRSVVSEDPPYCWSIGAFPFYGNTVTPNDSTDLAEPGYVRADADADGQVTVICRGNQQQLTLNLVAGEFFPCMVSRVPDTGTDAITLHVFY